MAFIIIMIGGILWGVLPYAVIMGLIIAMMMNEYINISVGKKFLLHKWLAIATGELFFILLLLVKMQYLETEYLLLAFVPLIFIFIANTAPANSAEEPLLLAYEMRLPMDTVAERDTDL